MTCFISLERLLIDFSGDAYNFILDVEGYPSSIIYFSVGFSSYVGVRPKCRDHLEPGSLYPCSFSWDKAS